MKPNVFIEGPKPATGLWYIDIAQGKDAVLGFMYNATTKSLTELALSDIMNLLKFSNF